MAFDRYDRDERARWSNDRDFDRAARDERERSRHGESGGREDRGFFERAGDEIASWFGNDESDGRDQRERSWNGRPQPERGNDLEYDRNRGSFGSGGSGERDYHPGARRDMWGSGERGSGQGGSTRRHDYRPVTGDYGRGGGHADSEQFFAASGVRRSGFGNDEPSRSGYDRAQAPYGRDHYRSTSDAGARKDDREFDPHYRSWRDRHVGELDRDYDDFRREHQAKFESDFTGWRERRQQKRGLLGQVREQMEVVGSDDRPVGTVHRVAGDRVILAADPDSGRGHQSLSCADIDRVDGDRVILDCSADQAKERVRDENRGRALFEREDQGEMGPRMLDRSFEGTYRR